jgi:hypothetical protein
MKSDRFFTRCSVFKEQFVFSIQPVCRPEEQYIMFTFSMQAPKYGNFSNCRFI